MDSNLTASVVSYGWEAIVYVSDDVPQWQHYDWLEWAEGIGGFWVSEGRRRAWEREALCANGQ